MQLKLSNYFQNARAFVLALVVHGVLLGLIVLNLDFSTASKPIAQPTMQATMVLDELIEPLQVAEPVPEPEPVIKEIEQPEPEPIIEEKPKPKLKEKYKYECDGVVYEVDSKVEAERLQLECDDKAKTKLDLAEKKKQEALKKKQQEKEKREEEKIRKKKQEEKKKKEEKKRVQQELKKEQERKKKAEAQKKRKLEEARKKKIADQKKKAEASRQKAAADQRARKAAMQAQIESERIQGEKNAAWRAAVGRIKQAVNNEFNIKLFSNGLRAYYIIQLQPSGHVVNVKLKRSSGNALYDEEGKRAILKASPLPIPTDSRYFESTIKYDHSS
ncbi:MAG: colicin import membrane protein [Saprospiraceae bacterium]|jgi:colicin import membrane protein